MGDAALWELAEGSLRETLDEFAGNGNWRVNPGDGAFYGPKIDIKVMNWWMYVYVCNAKQNKDIWEGGGGGCGAPMYPTINWGEMVCGVAR